MAKDIGDDEHDEHEAGAAGQLDMLEGGADANAPSAAAPRVAVARARQRSRNSGREISNFGTIPEGTTHWGVKRETRSGAWDPLSFGAGAVQSHTWPLDELTDDAIVARWGYGTFRTQWFKPNEGGGARFICQGSKVTYKEPTRDAPAPSAAEPRNVAMREHLEFLELVNSSAQSKIDSTLALARALRGDRDRDDRPSLSTEDLRGILRDEREAQAALLQQHLADQSARTQASIDAAVAPLRERLNELADDDDDDDETAVAGAIRTAGGGLSRKKGWLGIIGTIIENKDLLKELAPVALTALGTIAEVAKASQKAQAVAVEQQRPAPQARARGTTIDTTGETTVDPPVEQSEQDAAWSRLPVDAPKTNHVDSPQPATT